MGAIDEKYVAPARLRWMHGRGAIAVSDIDSSAPFDESIPWYLTLAPVEDGPTRERLDELLRRVHAGTSWKKALETTHPDLLTYVTDARRAAFIDLLPLHQQSDILEIGPGLGQFTATLARRSRHVHALEVVPQQAEFALLRSRQEGVSNVSVAVGGDDCRLPYRDGSFDGVVLNLVFEWCGSRNDSELHSEAQTRLLQEMVRVLRPGGFLYLATKNRFAIRLLLGGADEHMSNMRFGSALPRWIAAGLLKLKGRSRPAGKLYSHDALLAQIRRAGLADVESFWAVPEMRYPTAYVRSDPASVRSARRQAGLRQGEGRKAHWVMRFVPARWVRHVIPGLAFLAYKRRDPAHGASFRRGESEG